ncbi:50S ribosomal protein L22 [Sulfodiicoccus acidiphilus]|uniref:Large ribosomal subunit protein uL22 n=1 Tax=Sulfodiicoccus acidiphilus TaxID=1670455 RepID=A0A348B148_9CREN|nr:50S ribosomal protein L22 [Sulfodiicoccus acidiphilus]BBD71900.1 50S ribosomal protein L22 [Sulfodiicoccus acidiphilus]GGT91308.1 50S ribosomal protein L22 [Sulfodiicoccus acidiphilus]
MPEWTYPDLGIDEFKLAKAVGRDLSISPKDAYNVCKAIRGMKLSEAKKFLEEVIAKRTPIPYYRYNKRTSHKSGLNQRWGVKSGRYPVKVARELNKLLTNVEANAAGKGLDADSLKLVHVAVHKGIVMKRYMPRAFGRSTKKYKRTSTLEVVAAEVE